MTLQPFPFLRRQAPAIFLGLLLAARLASWFDDRFYPGELLVHFTALFALLGLFALLWIVYRRQFRLAIVALLAFVLWGREIPGGIDPEPVSASGRIVRFGQFNVSHILTDHRFVLDWLMGQGRNLDLVALQEVTPELRQRLMGMTGRFPYQILPATGKIDLALLSRWPLTHAEVRKFPGSDINYIIADVLPPGDRTPLRVYEFHTLAPTTPGNEQIRNAQLDYMGRTLKHDSSPLMLLVGDFNNTPYSYWFRRLEAVTGLRNTMEQTGVVGTWPRQLPLTWLRISIDNLLASRQIAALTKHAGPALDSDHLPVITTLQLPEDNRAEAEFGLPEPSGNI